MKKRKALGIFLMVGVIAAGLVIGLHNPLVVTRYQIPLTGLPKDLNGLRIVQISDLHYQRFGEWEGELLQKIKGEKPHLIFITGDTIDGTREDFEAVGSLLAGISSICPVYAVDGNHELDSEYYYGRLLRLYDKYGIRELNDKTAHITINGTTIAIYGIAYGEGLECVPKAEPDTFSIFLAHDPNVAEYITDCRYDIMFSGHLHGGIIRIPFVGGLLGNDRSFFPKYDGGLYQVGDMVLVNSRGLGETPHIPRFNNCPEVVSVTLTTALGHSD